MPKAIWQRAFYHINAAGAIDTRIACQGKSDSVASDSPLRQGSYRSLAAAGTTSPGILHGRTGPCAAWIRWPSDWRTWRTASSRRLETAASDSISRRASGRKSRIGVVLPAHDKAHTCGVR